MSGRSSRVLVVGKARPDTAGIASMLEDLVSAGVPGVELELLNLARPARGAAGRLSGANVRNTLADALRVWRGARSADVIHIHTALFPAVTMLRAGLLCLAGRAAGAGVVVHAHGGGLRDWLEGVSWHRSLARAALSGAHCIVCVSGSTAGPVARVVGASRVVHVPNGVDTGVFCPATVASHRADSPPRVLFAGYLTPRKGVLDLLAAAERLRARGVAHELVLAGGVPPEGVGAAARVRSAAAGSGARLVGAQPRSAMPELYREADIFCLPSWREAMPLTVLEAMASGLPVVATDVGEIGSMVEDGTTGVLVRTRDPDGLADALADLIGDADRREALGRAARAAAVERFDSSLLRAALATVYADLAR